MKGRKSLRWLTAPQEPHLSCLRNTNHLSFLFSFFGVVFFSPCLSSSSIVPSINTPDGNQALVPALMVPSLPRCQVVASPYLR
ncbi:hypothetical protein V8C44DRAFT_183044 [Trichoderma aethiopicum]